MENKKIKVTFIKDAHVNGEIEFKKGDKKELNFASAMRWIVRGIAVEGDVKPEIKEEEVKPEIKEEEKEVVVEEKPSKKNKNKRAKEEENSL